MENGLDDWTFRHGFASSLHEETPAFLDFVAWRIIPVSKLVTPIYKPWMVIWKGSHNPILGGQKLTMGPINHVPKSWEPILQAGPMNKIGGESKPSLDYTLFNAKHP